MSEKVFLAKYPVHSALRRPHVHKPARGWDINDPVFRHRAVMALFPEFEGTKPRSTNNILFRLDLIPGQAPYFLVQSRVRPENLDGVDGLQIKEVEIQQIAAGTPVRFRVAINAVRRKGTGGVSPVPMEATDGEVGVPEWLASKLESGLTNVTIVNHTRAVLGGDRRGKTPSATHVVQVDTIDGVAEVSSPEGLQELVLKGVGRAKSYGCGLLSVQPLR
ncbi:type I-E CRISPR-associated protein Cas6/Cse3/CasE [Trueperella bernardiae]|nr:type I-E CRISPR-associated protein Cas6/Cse3/CasE [Trueperella bernardiae]OCW59724.1 hypothetical protein AKG36_08865 [Trueperella bernardiae]PKZ89107.1 type I-E CRISPR-associated protein Cas6/Cse3/CasE [Trueperella bernardiae]